MKIESENQNWKSKLKIEIENQNWKLKLKIDIRNWKSQLKIEIENGNWKLVLYNWKSEIVNCIFKLFNPILGLLSALSDKGGIHLFLL